MKQHFKTHWLSYLLAIGLIICLLFLFNSNPVIDSHKTENAAIIQENKDLKAKQETAERIIHTLRDSLTVRDARIRDVTAEQVATKKELNKSKSVVNRLADDVRELQKGDTSRLARKADSLQQWVRELTALNDMYVAYTDTLAHENARQKEDYERLIAERDKVYIAQKESYDKLLIAYQGLFADYQKVAKKVKRANLKTKVAAVLAIAAGVLAVTK